MVPAVASYHWLASKLHMSVWGALVTCATAGGQSGHTHRTMTALCPLPLPLFMHYPGQESHPAALRDVIIRNWIRLALRGETTALFLLSYRLNLVYQDLLNLLMQQWVQRVHRCRTEYVKVPRLQTQHTWIRPSTVTDQFFFRKTKDCFLIPQSLSPALPPPHPPLPPVIVEYICICTFSSCHQHQTFVVANILLSIWSPTFFFNKEIDLIIKYNFFLAIKYDILFKVTCISYNSTLNSPVVEMC